MHSDAFLQTKLIQTPLYIDDVVKIFDTARTGVQQSIRQRFKGGRDFYLTTSFDIAFPM